MARSFSLPLDLVTNGGGALGVAADHEGGLWVVGAFAGSVTFGSVTLSGPTTSNGAQFFLISRHEGVFGWTP